MGDLSNHFSRAEFQCPDCGRVYVSPHLIDLLERAREEFERPIVINSGFRCPAHNAAIGGRPQSAHLTGEAADIRCLDPRTRMQLVRIFLELGCRRIEVCRTWIHVDVSLSNVQDVLLLEGE